MSIARTFAATAAALALTATLGASTAHAGMCTTEMRAVNGDGSVTITITEVDCKGSDPAGTRYVYGYTGQPVYWAVRPGTSGYNSSAGSTTRTRSSGSSSTSTSTHNSTTGQTSTTTTYASSSTNAANQTKTGRATAQTSAAR